MRGNTATMQIGEWARVFCTGDAQNGALKHRWVMGVLSVIRSDGDAEIMNPRPLVASEKLDVISPGPYICEEVIQIGDWIRGIRAKDAQNRGLRGDNFQGWVSRFRPDGTVEVISPYYNPYNPDASALYICDAVWNAHDKAPSYANSPKPFRKWLQRHFATHGLSWPPKTG